MLGTMILAWLATDPPLCVQKMGDGDPSQGSLVVSTVAGSWFEYSYADDVFTARIVDQGIGETVTFYRDLPMQWRNVPLVMVEDGPPCTTRFVLGPDSVQVGNRVQPCRSDDGTNRFLRIEKRIPPGGPPGNDMQWTIIMAPCHPADLDGSGVVDGADLTILLGSWGSQSKWAVADIDGSGTVDAADLTILLGSWGQGFGLPV